VLGIQTSNRLADICCMPLSVKYNIFFPSF
jgi:hypothetical protein